MGRTAEFSFRTRANNLAALARERFDVLVIGGGITGAGVARDAALRGLSVGVIERRDFAAGTSSRSSKLVHGGLRYLAQGEIGLVREAATERHALRRLAPHLARPVPMLVPVHSRRGYLALQAGLWTYDHLARVAAAERHRMLGATETRALEPAVRPDRLAGAGLYYEYLTDDARLVVEVVKSAAALGAVIVNHAEVAGFVTDGGRIAGVTVRDQLTGAEFVARGRVVVNAAGPWVDAVRLRAEPGAAPRLHLTKGVHLALPHQRLPVSGIVVMQASDRRGVYAIPRGDVTYVGTTDTDHRQPEDEPAITRADVAYLFDAVQRTFAVEPLTPRDLVSAWAGLRPLLHQEGKRPSELSRKDEIMMGATGLLSIAGGKLTTFRRMAERIVDLVCERLREAGGGLPRRRGDSAEATLSGGDTGDDVDAYARRLQVRRPAVGADIVERLVRLYGSNAEALVEAMAADPGLAERYAPALSLTRAEVAYAVHEEMAMNLADVLDRRSRLLVWDAQNGLAVAARVADDMAGWLGWDPRRTADEVARYGAQVERMKHVDGDEPLVEPIRVAHG